MRVHITQEPVTKERKENQMRKISLSALLLFIIISFLAGIGTAGENATKAECVAKCKEAAALVKEIGLESAIQKIMDKTGPFVWKDTYVFCVDIETGITLANPVTPKLVGKMIKGLKDKTGKLFAVEYLNIAKNKGEGWVTYMWPKPGETEPWPKTTYVYRVPGENVAMLAGIYE